MLVNSKKMLKEAKKNKKAVFQFNINNLDIKDNFKLLFESILNNAKELKLPEEYLEIINFNTL